MTDPDAVSAFGPGLSSASIGKPTDFTLHADGVSKDDVRIVVKGIIIPTVLIF